MANVTMAMEPYGLPQIQERMKSELRRLSLHRLKESANDPEESIDHLTAAGVLTKKFAALVRKILKRAPTSHPREKSLELASDTLAVLKFVPNRRGSLSD